VFDKKNLIEEDEISKYFDIVKNNSRGKVYFEIIMIMMY
jgi:hypothetical protein